MRVAGTAAAPIDFWIPAPNNRDRYIKTLAFTISDLNATLNSFGTITALTNGCQLIWVNDRGGENILANNLTTNFRFVRMCAGQPAFGNGATAFRASNVSGNSEGYLPVLDFDLVYGLPFGVQLKENTRQRILLRVRDDTSTVDAFECVASGFDRKNPETLE